MTTDDDIQQENYRKYRGKCKEVSEALVAADPTLTLVRGYYHDPIWGKQPHWWCKKPDGTIVDETKLQFPSAGNGYYEEFDGWFECSECGKKIREEEGNIEGNYIFCSTLCHGRFVGVL